MGNLPTANPLKRIAIAAISFFTGLIGAYVGYPLMNTFLSLFDLSDPLVKGIAWLGFIVLLILAIIVVPAYELFSIGDGTDGV